MPAIQSARLVVQTFFPFETASSASTTRCRSARSRDQ
jgi:hypothetical protein